MNATRQSSVAGYAALIAAALLGAAAVSLPLQAAQTDISNTPLASTTSAAIKPNIMLLMDTSGSMGWGHMPDEVESITGIGSVGYKSAQCNVLYYNPAQRYQLPKQADGTFFPTPGFGASPGARYDAFNTASSTVVDLSSAFKAYDDHTLRVGGYNDTPQAAYYYVYAGPQTLSYKAAPCTDPDTFAADGLMSKTATGTGGGTWTRKIVSATSGTGPTGADERQNFAIWYTYYRTRMNLTKSAASLAFTPLTDSFRLGFITVQPKDTPNASSINANKYLPIADFNSTQRDAWFSKLFSQTASGASPAREGLARVGRHYGGKQDGINSGMTGDPVQFYCQQNFTIMTTDGYWNDQTETPGAGPVKLDGVTHVGQQDGTLTDGAPWTPRPIWEGFPGSTQIVTDKNNSYYTALCTGAYYNVGTAQTFRRTVQIMSATTQMLKATTQYLQSTNQNLQSTVQNLISTEQMRQSTTQYLQSTTQYVQSTNQIVKNTSQLTRTRTRSKSTVTQPQASTYQTLQTTLQEIQGTAQIFQTITINQQSSVQNLRSTTQIRQSTQINRQSTLQHLQNTTQILATTMQDTKSTAQTTQSTLQNLQSTLQYRKTTLQNLQSTAQVTQSTSQNRMFTLQLNKTTTRLLLSTTQRRQTTTQVRSCDASTELCTPVGPLDCTPSGLITCMTITAGPTLVANCVPATADASNIYITTACDLTTTGPTAVGSCAPIDASAGNSFVATTCQTEVVGPTPSAACTDAAASSGNFWVATSCSNIPTGPTPVASCSPQAASSGNNYVATTCDNPTTGPTGVASCTGAAASSGNSYVATTCGSNNTSNVAVQTCTPSGANSGNGYTTTTCSTNNSIDQPAQTCGASAATSANQWVTTSCTTVATNNVPVASCTPQTADAGNAWVTITCPAPITTAVVGVDTCVGAAAAVGNNWVATVCGANNTSNVGVPPGSCVAAPRNAGNQWVTTTCGTNNNIAAPAASCSASAATPANQYVTTSCPAPIVNTNIPTLSCSPVAATSGNSYTAITCAPDSVTTNVAVASCTPAAATSGNSWTATTCSATVTGPTGVQTCTPQTADLSNGWQTITCDTYQLLNEAVASCTPQTAASGNQWTEITCPAPVISSSGTGTCVPQTGNAGNGWVTITCPAPTVVSGPTAVASCTPQTGNAGNGWQTITCATTTSGGPVSGCVPQTGDASNNWVTITCGANNAYNVPVQTCTPQAPTVGNNYTTITCSNNNQLSVPVASCTASTAASSNSWVTTTCATVVITPETAVQTCTPAAASSGNGYQTVTCITETQGPTGVEDCNPSGATGPNWWTTTCPTATQNNIPVLSCTPHGAHDWNDWTETTCPDPIVSTNVPIANVCVPVARASSGTYTEVTCPDPVVTTNVPVASCSVSAATSLNSYVATSCSTVSTTNVPVASCIAASANGTNSYTATTCSPNNSYNQATASCTPSDPISGNAYVKTTCPAPITTTAVPVATCIPASANSGNGWTTVTCPAAIVTTDVPVGSCSASAASSGTQWTSTTCRTVSTGPAGADTCTAAAASSGNSWVATTCTPNNTATHGVSTCTDITGNSGNGWATTTCNTLDSGWVAQAAACTASPASSGNGWVETTCNATGNGTGLSTTCTPQSPTADNGYVTITCPLAPGQKIVTTTTTTVTSTPTSGVTAVGAPTTTSSSTTSDYNGGMCYIPGVDPVLPDLASLPAKPSPPSGCTAWPCTTTVANPGGSVDSLADVAQYYYVTDLRPELQDGVPAIGAGLEDDNAPWQHMTTFTIALGVSGTLNYNPLYRSAGTPGDFADIRAGTIGWPVWPDSNLNYGNKDNWNNAKSIDDFWHAAVNGRGQYFSAGDPTAVINGLGSALAGISTHLFFSHVGLSTLTPVSGDNFAYAPSYKTSLWSGDVQARALDLTNGTMGATTIWSATAKLNSKIGNACDNRSIYLLRVGATDNLVDFAWNTSTCDVNGNPATSRAGTLTSSERDQFGALNTSLLSQYPNMTDGTAGTVDQRTAAAGANMVNFLRGQRGNEGFVSDVAGKLYRTRDDAGVLGAIINAQPVYVRAPFSNYADDGYDAFKSSQSSRAHMLYVAANDGMLHAFKATGTDTEVGQEAWAVIPSAVLPRLYKLADASYGTNPEWTVDGTPSVGDAKIGGDWKTLLVAGLNGGGKGYYALDVTNPASPKALWEFKWSNTCYDSGNPATASADCHLGFTYGRPWITKLADGTWVVMVTSGYNNVNAPSKAGDGQGYLYVLDAANGHIIYKISTGQGDATTPSGLAQIGIFVDNATLNNTALRAYGGDLFGNVWRFDFNGVQSANLVGTAKDSGGNPQPITVRPNLAEVRGKPIVLVATGRLLGLTDMADTQVQSIYGIVDLLSDGPVYTDLRAALKPLTMTSSGSGVSLTRTVACSGDTAACGSTKGWVVDLPISGERVNVDMALQLGTLVAASNVPRGDDLCQLGGSSMVNFLDFATGGAVVTAPGGIVSATLAGSMTFGVDVYKLPGGDTKYGGSTGGGGGAGSPGSGGLVTGPVPTGPGPASHKEVSWREVTQ